MAEEFNRGTTEYAIVGPKPGDKAILRALNAPIVYNGEGWDLTLADDTVITLPNAIDPSGASLTFLANVMGENALRKAREQWREGEEWASESIEAAGQIDQREPQQNTLQLLLNHVGATAPVPLPGAPALVPAIEDPWMEPQGPELPGPRPLGPDPTARVEPHPEDPHNQEWPTWQAQPESPYHEGSYRLQNGPNFRAMPQADEGRADDVFPPNPMEAGEYPPIREVSQEDLEFEELVRKEFGDHRLRQRRARDEHIAAAGQPAAAVGLSFDPLMVNSLNEDAYEYWLSCATEEQLAQYWKFLAMHSRGRLH